MIENHGFPNSLKVCVFGGGFLAGKIFWGRIFCKGEFIGGEFFQGGRISRLLPSAQPNSPIRENPVNCDKFEAFILDKKKRDYPEL